MSDYHEKSDCGQYSVCAFSTLGIWKFEAWRKGNPDKFLGVFSDAQTARDCCQTDKGSA